MNPVLSWPGGKRLLAPRIVEKLSPHQRYVEPFGGGLAVLLCKERSPVEIVNDLNSELITFYRCVRYHPDAVLAELELVLNAREEFEAALAQPGLTDIQRAARFLIRNKLSFGGKGEHFASGRTRPPGSWANRRAAIKELSERLDRVWIEHLDWRVVLDRYDAEDTCFYLDPPYTAGYQYRGLAWSETDHEELRDRMLALKGAWVLSYDDSPLVQSLYSTSRIQRVDRPNTLGNNHGHAGQRFGEAIITRAS